MLLSVKLLISTLLLYLQCKQLLGCHIAVVPSVLG